MVVHALIGPQPAFTLSGVRPPSWIGYTLLPLVAAAASAVGILFQRGSLALRASCKTMHHIPPWARPIFGGVATWLLGVAVFLSSGHLGVFSLGYDDLSAALAGNIAWHIAAVLLFTKLAATIACYGFGGCGGIFSPTLFLGGMTGIAISGLLARGLPIPGNDQIVLGVVGMSACLGAVVGAPVTGILIVFEMTHEFSLVPALMLGALVSQGLRRLWSPSNFYESILRQDGHELEQLVPPRDLADWQQLPASAIANFKPVIVENLDEAGLSNFLQQFPYSRFPVVIENELRGVLSRSEVITARKDNRLPQLHTARTIRPRLPIREAQTLLLESEDSLVIIQDDASRQVIAIITLHDLLRAQLSFAEKKN